MERYQIFYATSLTDLSGASNGTASSSYNVWKFIVNGDGTNSKEPLTRNTNASLDSTQAISTLDGKKVIFTSKQDLTGTVNGTASGSSNIWIMNADGSNQIALTRNTSAGLDSNFTTLTRSHDGKKIIFGSKTALNGTWNGTATSSVNIWVINIDGTGLTAITQNSNVSLDSSNAIFSPDDSKIAFSSLTALNGDWNGTATSSKNFWIMNSDGTNRTPLSYNSNSGLDSTQIDFTPDGTKIVFVSHTALDGTWNGTAVLNNTWIMNVDGSDRVAITHGITSPSTNSVISPDGTKIVMQSKAPLDGTWSGTPAAQYNIWIMNLDGSNRTALTRNQTTLAVSNGASFSPDSKKIMYVSSENLSGVFDGVITSGWNLWVMNADGTGRTNLTANTNSGLVTSSGLFNAWYQSKSCQ